MADADDKSAGAAGGAEGGGAAAADPKPAVTFKTEGEFLAAVEKRSKGAISKAVEAAKAEILGSLGVETLDDLGSVKERLASTEKTVSEAEKLKAAHDKAVKELDKEKRRGGELTGRLQKIAKRDALMPFMTQVRDSEALAMFAEPHLEVDDEGVVTVKNGRSVEDLVGDILKAKDYLKNPAHKDGAGTTATEPRAAAGGKGSDAQTDDKAKTNGTEAPKYKSFGEAIMADLKAKGQLPRVGP